MWVRDKADGAIEVLASLPSRGQGKIYVWQFPFSCGSGDVVWLAVLGTNSLLPQWGEGRLLNH